MTRYVPRFLPPVLPVELHVVQEQIRARDGRFRFRVQWYVLGSSIYNLVSVRRTTKWSAGTIEEMLHAIEAANTAIGSCPGIRPDELPTKDRCPECGQLYNFGHTPAACKKALDNARKQAAMGSYTRRLKDTAIWELKNKLRRWSLMGRRLERKARSQGLDWDLWGRGFRSEWSNNSWRQGD